MPTPQTLVQQGRLEAIEVELDPDELPERLIYAHPRVVRWLEEVLPTLQSDNYVPGALRPEEQTDVLLYQLISGQGQVALPPKCLRPQEDGVWELRTHDLRFFGWFWRPKIFIMTSIEVASRCKELNLYGGHRDQAKHFRDGLDLEPPKFVSGEIEDVL